MKTEVTTVGENEVRLSVEVPHDEVKAEIEPTGPATHFTTIIPRMENGEKRVVAHNLFSDRDGVPFSARNVKASRITVTAMDIDKKPYRVEMPWKK